MDKEENRKYYVMPCDQAPTSVCGPFLIHRISWHKILDVTRRFCAIHSFLCFLFFFSKLTLCRKNTQQPTWTYYPCRGSMRKGSHQFWLEKDYREERNILYLAFLALAAPVDLRTITPKAESSCAVWKDQTSWPSDPVQVHTAQFYRGGLPSEATPLCL